MIVTSPLSGGGGADAAAAAEKKTGQTEKSMAELGQSEFLTLLMAQLKHQDPMKPMENTDFTAQMAQFSSLEQLLNMNKSMEAMASASAEATATQAVSLIGKEVTAGGNSVEVSGGTASDISFTLPNSAGKAVVTIENGRGEAVREIELSSLSAGDHSVPWSGGDDLGNPLPDGRYTFSVSAKGPDGKQMDVATRAKGIATGVSFEDGVTYVHVGQNKFTLGEIIEVRDVRPDSGAGAGAEASGGTTA
ncbi:MAG: flagellar hook assembly protein FlgD [Candidatus Nitrospinota bacterium M3_3B_026]